ncbi:hypothetical protein ACAW74_12275 [Fibrella sp. WM1]|uniref:hypothetical protein n=1 Tax=Fibrella musci TaxID=3242485 RepID=UPI0035209974
MPFRLNVWLLLCLSWPATTLASAPPGVGFKKLVGARYVSRRPTYLAPTASPRTPASIRGNRLSLLRPLRLLR